MILSIFSHARLKNEMAPGTEGGLTRHWPAAS